MQMQLVIGVLPADGARVHLITLMGTAIVPVHLISPAQAERTVERAVGGARVHQVFSAAVGQFYIELFDINGAVLGVQAARRMSGVTGDSIVDNV